MRKDYLEHITSKAIILFLIITCFSLTSCEKDIVDKFTPLDENWTSINEFINNTEFSQTINVANAELEYVFETDLAVYKIQQASIEDLTGSFISGPMSIEITELQKPGDYILSNLHTKDIVGDNLHNQFACKFQFKQGNAVLRLKEDKPIQAYLKSDNTTLSSEATFEWETSSNNSGWISTIGFNVNINSWDFYSNDVHYVGSGYKMEIGNHSWFAMGDFESLLFPNVDDFGTLEVTIDSEFHNNDTRIYASHKNNMALVPIDSNNGIYSQGQILKDELIRVIGLTTIDGKLFYGRTDFIAGVSNDYDLSFKEVAYYELIEELKRL